MSQLSPFLIGLWMIGFAINSFAEDGNCIGISGPISQQGIQLSACKCDKNIHKLSINEHTDLPLVAVCNYVKEDWGQTGDYFFKGNLLISGVITREETETFGDTVRFYGEAKDAQVLFNGSGPDLRFQDQNAFVSAVRAPTITSNARCWSAKASMRIELMYTSAGPGTDADGTYILQYKMLNVGKFKKCKQVNLSNDDS